MPDVLDSWIRISNLLRKTTLLYVAVRIEPRDVEYSYVERIQYNRADKSGQYNILVRPTKSVLLSIPSHTQTHSTIDQHQHSPSQCLAIIRKSLAHPPPKHSPEAR